MINSKALASLKRGSPMFEELTIHARTILSLKRDFPLSKTKGFRKAIQKLQWDWEDWDSSEEKPTWKDFMDCGEAWKGGIIPDLWFIDEECMSVICIEVEDTSKINTTKMNQYVALWWHLDEMYWELHLLCSDRWGNLTPVPVTNFTSMGLVELEKNHLANVIQAERDAKRVTFELTEIYSNRDNHARSAKRAEWLQKYPDFGLMTNPRFNKKEFLRKRSIQVS